MVSLGHRSGIGTAGMIQLGIRTGNRILDRLPVADFRRISVHLEQVSPSLGEVISSPGIEPRWVYFPVSGILSTMIVLDWLNDRMLPTIVARKAKTASTPT